MAIVPEVSSVGKSAGIKIPTDREGRFIDSRAAGFVTKKNFKQDDDA